MKKLAVSDMPMQAENIWCLRKLEKMKNSLVEKIVLGFSDRVIVLEAGEKIGEY